jgi:5-methylcytosine-specific restriction endonuclease McrA
MPYLLNGKTAREERQERKAAKAANLREVYALVDRRDQGKCRACGRRCSTTATASEDRAERHHVRPRSLGGPDTVENLATVCVWCHDDRHKKGTLRISGNADERDQLGVLCGLTIERLTDSGWKVVNLS